MSDRYTICPVCRSSILTERIERHRLIHEQEADELRAESAFDTNLHARSISESRSPNLDATKDMCYPAREQGKYGSHAAHDAFDDESGS